MVPIGSGAGGRAGFSTGCNVSGVVLYSVSRISVPCCHG